MYIIGRPREISIYGVPKRETVLLVSASLGKHADKRARDSRTHRAQEFPHSVIPRIAQEQYFVGKAFRLLKLRASYPILKLA